MGGVAVTGDPGMVGSRLGLEDSHDQASCQVYSICDAERRLQEPEKMVVQVKRALLILP